jgi:hypothetical protein
MSLAQFLNPPKQLRGGNITITKQSCAMAMPLTQTRFPKTVIYCHLLGLAPAGYMTAPDNGPEGLMRDGASQCDGCRAVPLNLLNRV